MDFGLTREQIALREGLRRILASQPEGPWLWDALYERGVLGALLPSDAGGTDGSGSTVAIICEELGRACANVPVLDSVLVCARLLAQHPDFEDLGEALMTGRQRAAFAGLELETARYDWGSGVSVQGDRLTGQKLMVTGGDEADWIVVTTADGLYLVARDVPGMSRRKTMMLGGLTGADLVFRDSPAVRIGGVEDDLQTIALGVLGRCADALGAMGATRDLTIDMLRQRRGAATGSHFRADSHRLADMAIAIDHARSALVNFAIHADHPFAVQGWHAAAAKATISQAARQGRGSGHRRPRCRRAGRGRADCPAAAAALAGRDDLWRTRPQRRLDGAEAVVGGPGVTGRLIRRCRIPGPEGCRG